MSNIPRTYLVAPLCTVQVGPSLVAAVVPYVYFAVWQLADERLLIAAVARVPTTRGTRKSGAHGRLLSQWLGLICIRPILIAERPSVGPRPFTSVGHLELREHAALPAGSLSAADVRPTQPVLLQKADVREAAESEVVHRARYARKASAHSSARRVRVHP